MLVKLQRLLCNDICIVALIALLFGVFLHWEAFVQSDRFHDNWRQAPQWTDPQSQQFHPDDLLIRYAHFNTSPFANFLYKNLARTGIDIFWGKVNAVLFFTFAVISVFVAARAAGDRLSGWLATILFLFFPCVFKNFSGGFMSGLSGFFPAVTIYIIFRKKWWWAIPLLSLEAVIYPMVAVQSGVMFVFDYLLHDVKNTFNPVLWKTKFLPLLLAAVISFGVMTAKYSASSHEFGDLISSRIEMSKRIEFTSQGRSSLIPVAPLWSQIHKHWGNAFHIALLLTTYFFLGKRTFRLPRGLYALLFSGCLLYWLADIFMMQLYFPNRYLKHAFPVFMALAGGYWLTIIVRQEKKKIVVWMSIVLTVVGLYEFHDTLQPRSLGTYRYSKHELYAFIRALPGRPMIAAHPGLGSEIPVMTGKSVFISRELSHPWWTNYWNIITNRTLDFFTAYYATEKRHIINFITTHHIDYWIISHWHFTEAYIQAQNFYIQPFNFWIHYRLHPSSNSLLNFIPFHDRLYRDAHYSVVSSEDLLSWLEHEVK